MKSQNRVIKIILLSVILWLIVISAIGQSIFVFKGGNQLTSISKCNIIGVAHAGTDSVNIYYNRWKLFFSGYTDHGSVTYPILCKKPLVENNWRTFFARDIPLVVCEGNYYDTNKPNKNKHQTTSPCGIFRIVKVLNYGLFLYLYPDKESKANEGFARQQVQPVNTYIYSLCK